MVQTRHLRPSARALGSNGRVDAPGEKQPKLASLPVPVREMHAALVGRVQHQLLKVPSAEEEGFMYLTSTMARKLAASALAGQLKLVEFMAAPRLLLRAAAPEKGSLDELREAWALLRVALVAVREEIYSMSSSDAGVMRMEAKMHATAKSLRIIAKDLERWIRRVLESWELLCHDFRLLDGPMPPSRNVRHLRLEPIGDCVVSISHEERDPDRTQVRYLERRKVEAEAMQTIGKDRLGQREGSCKRG